MSQQAKLVVLDGNKQIKLYSNDTLNLDGFKYEQTAPDFILGVAYAMSRFAETLRDARKDRIEAVGEDAVRMDEVRAFADILRKRLQRKAGSLSVNLAHIAVANR